MSHPGMSDSAQKIRLEERRGGLPAGLGAVPLLIAEFEDWSRQWQDDADRWTAFDRFVRDQLHSILGATRVRCFRILDDGESLESLSPSREPFATAVSAREGVYGYVFSRGYPGSRGRLAGLPGGRRAQRTRTHGRVAGSEAALEGVAGRPAERARDRRGQVLRVPARRADRVCPRSPRRLGRVVPRRGWCR